MRPRRGQCGAALSAGRPDRGDPPRALGEWMRVSPRLGMGSRARSALGLASGRWAGGLGDGGEECGSLGQASGSLCGGVRTAGESWFVWEERPGQASGVVSGPLPGRPPSSPCPSWQQRGCVSLSASFLLLFFFYYLMKTVCFHLGDQTLHRAD